MENVIYSVGHRHITHYVVIFSVTNQLPVS